MYLCKGSFKGNYCYVRTVLSKILYNLNILYKKQIKNSIHSYSCGYYQLCRFRISLPILTYRMTQLQIPPLNDCKQN